MNHEKLVSYCLGSLSSRERLEVEEALLSSKEVLQEFISLKRALESESGFDVEPSLRLKSKLRREIEKNFGLEQRFVFGWLTGVPLRPAMGIAFGIFLISGISSVFLIRSEPKLKLIKPAGISVDAANQTPVSFDFL